MSRIRVLIADDDALVRRAVATLLEAAGDLDVVGEAEDGQQAVELTSRVHPDVVLMDYGMPRLDGLEATRRILADHPDCRVVGLSVHEQEIGSELCDAGAVTYLTKDCAPDALLEAVRYAAGRPARPK